MRAIVALGSLAAAVSASNDTQQCCQRRQPQIFCPVDRNATVCDAAMVALGATPGVYEGSDHLKVLSYQTLKRYPALFHSAAAMLECTGLVVDIKDLENGLRKETNIDLGYPSGLGENIYDAYMTKSSWAAEYSDQTLLEPLNSHIRKKDAGLRWEEVLQ